MLITTVPVVSTEQAREVLDLYGLRWRIEDWHRILKTGCDVEKIAHNTAVRLERAITINAVIAYRLAALTRLGRETPELPATVMFSEAEIVVLRDFAAVRKIKGPAGDSDIPLSLGSAVLLIACLGGYLNRKNDTPPGHQILWEGYTRLNIGAQTLERAKEVGEKSGVARYISAVIND